MGLSELQSTLARLYTDQALRTEFLGQPLLVGAKVGLTMEEATALARISPTQLSLFARSLKRKRLIEVRKLLAHSSALLGEQFPVLFDEYLAVESNQDPSDHYADAVAFARFLGRTQVRPWPFGPAIALAQYEATFSRLHGRSFVLFFRVLKTLPQCHSAYEDSPEPRRGHRGIAVWLRLGANRNPIHKVFRVSLPFQRTAGANSPPGPMEGVVR